MFFKTKQKVEESTEGEFYILKLIFGISKKLGITPQELVDYLDDKNTSSSYMKEIIKLKLDKMTD